MSLSLVVVLSSSAAHTPRPIDPELCHPIEYYIFRDNLMYVCRLSKTNEHRLEATDGGCEYVLFKQNCAKLVQSSLSTNG